MLNVIEDARKAIEEAAKAAVAAASTQTNQVVNELASLSDELQMVNHNLDVAMQAYDAKIAEAEKIRTAGLQEHAQASSRVLALALSIIQQLNAGMMVTGSKEPLPSAKTKPKLVVGGEAVQS